jgi:hypothetical protein
VSAAGFDDLPLTRAGRVVCAIGPYTKPGTQSTRLFNHYSLLRTTERLLGVPNRDVLGQARKARNMRHQFRL